MGLADIYSNDRILKACTESVATEFICAEMGKNKFYLISSLCFKLRLLDYIVSLSHAKPNSLSCTQETTFFFGGGVRFLTN